MLRPKNVVLFQRNDQVKIFLSVSRPHSRMCIRIYTFNLKKKQTNKKETRIQKKKKGEREYLQKIDKKINLRLTG